MYYTGLDPYTMGEVYCAKNPHEKALQRALLQYYNPDNRQRVEEALRRAHRTDLIGTSDKCLVRPSAPQRGRQKNKSNKYKRRT